MPSMGVSPSMTPEVGLGTIWALRAEFAPKIPWYLIMFFRGGGIKEVRRDKNSTGGITKCEVPSTQGVFKRTMMLPFEATDRRSSEIGGRPM